jgi:hypothetical protein
MKPPKHRVASAYNDNSPLTKGEGSDFFKSLKSALNWGKLA